jgi:hypothetical protein
MKAREVVQGWLKEHQTQIGVEPSKWESSDLYAEKFIAWYETDTHLIDICCWNNADCLDIIALNKNTKKEDFMVAGECDGQMGLSQRLREFLAWLKTTQ